MAVIAAGAATGMAVPAGGKVRLTSKAGVSASRPCQMVPSTLRERLSQSVLSVNALTD